MKRGKSLQDSIALLVAGITGAGAVLFALGLWIHFSMQPPKESTTVAHFYGHRAQYDQLRAMLLSDNRLAGVDSWGVQLATGPPVGRMPPVGGISLDRFHRYLALLDEIGGNAAYRTEGEHPEVGVSVWAAGWAGSSRHVDICWREDEPTNQVASLDEFYRTPEPRKPVYRHIDGNWWMRADW